MKMRERKHLFWWFPNTKIFMRSHNRKVKPLPQTYWVGKGSHAYLKGKYDSWDNWKRKQA